MAAPKRIRAFSRERVGGVNVDAEVYSGEERRIIGGHSVWAGKRKNDGWRIVKMSDLPKLLPGPTKNLVENSAKKLISIFHNMVKKSNGNKARAKATFIRWMITRGNAVVINGDFLGAKIGKGITLDEIPIYGMIAYNPFTNKFWYVSTRRQQEQITEDDSFGNNFGKG